MRLESIGLRYIQAGAVLVDGWIETVYRLHEHFDIGRRTTSTQRDRWVLGSWRARSLTSARRCSTAKSNGAASTRRKHPIHIGDNQTDHGCGSFRPCSHIPSLSRGAHTMPP